jgi:hypothetical protein
MAASDWAGDRHGRPVRFDLAPHLGASLLWCTGFSLISVFAPPPPAAGPLLHRALARALSPTRLLTLPTISRDAILSERVEVTAIALASSIVHVRFAGAAIFTPQ